MADASPSDPSPSPESSPQTVQRQLRRERWRLLARLDAALEKPMIGLAVVWLLLLIIDLTRGLSPPLLVVHYTIWALFIGQFLMGLAIAPRRGRYLRRNWLTAVSLMLPALRILRVVQALRGLRAVRLLGTTRAARSVGLVRTLGSINRGMRATRHALGRHALGYMIALTVIVIFTGAAALSWFENAAAVAAAGGPSGEPLHRYSDALWWSAMIMGTIGVDRWPVTPMGRLVAWMLAMYGLAVFGYITATIATIFLGPRPGSDAEKNQINQLRRENRELRAEVRSLRRERP